MGDLTVTGFVPGRSLLHRMDPRTKQALLMILSAASLWGAFSFLALLSVILACCFDAAQVRWGRLMHDIRYFLVFLILIFALRTLRFEDSWMPALSGASAADAILVCWRLLLVVLMGLLVIVTTRMSHIRAALIWYLRPIPLIDEKMTATMVGLVVRFLPHILLQASEVSDAQRARCIERRKNPLVRLRCFAIALFRRVFWAADELVAAMQARGYHENRTPPDLMFTRYDAVAMLGAVLISLTIFLP